MFSFAWGSRLRTLLKMSVRPRVAVVTSSIGRPELHDCIASVRAQTYEATHFVYVNGPKYHANARQVLERFPDVHALYLPEETGDYGTGFSMADVFAASAFLTTADFIFFLNDDDSYDPEHIESVMKLIQANDLQWAYSLRRFVDLKGRAIVDDDWCSLGHFPIIGTQEYLVDNSCYAVSRKLAQRLALAWTALPVIADRCFLAALKATNARSGCTGLSTVNYRVGTGTADADPDTYLKCAVKAQELYPTGFPWRKKAVFGSPHPALPVSSAE